MDLPISRAYSRFSPILGSMLMLWVETGVRFVCLGTDLSNRGNQWNYMKRVEWCGVSLNFVTSPQLEIGLVHRFPGWIMDEEKGLVASTGHLCHRIWGSILHPSDRQRRHTHAGNDQRTWRQESHGGGWSLWLRLKKMEDFCGWLAPHLMNVAAVACWNDLDE